MSVDDFNITHIYVAQVGLPVGQSLFAGWIWVGTKLSSDCKTNTAVKMHINHCGERDNVLQETDCHHFKGLRQREINKILI